MFIQDRHFLKDLTVLTRIESVGRLVCNQELKSPIDKSDLLASKYDRLMSEPFTKEIKNEILIYNQNLNIYF